MSNESRYAQPHSPAPELAIADDERQCCAQFGCGKTLTFREKLFGKYCINHQQTNSRHDSPKTTNRHLPK